LISAGSIHAGIHLCLQHHAGTTVHKTGSDGSYISYSGLYDQCECETGKDYPDGLVNGEGLDKWSEHVYCVATM